MRVARLRPLYDRVAARFPEIYDGVLITALQRRSDDRHPRHVSALTNDTAPFRQRHNVGVLGSRPLGKTNFVCFQAATATCGTVIVNGLWCSKARSRRPTIVYFGLWVGGKCFG